MEKITILINQRPFKVENSTLTPEDFRSAFITAQGWGTFSQKRKGETQTETLRLNWGQLNLKQMAFDIPTDKTAADVKLKVSGKR